MVTYTSTYNLKLPAVGQDDDVWGGYVNDNTNALESILTGNTTITSLVITTADINGGTLDNVVIGGSTAAAVTGTTITGTGFVSSGNMTFGDSNKAIFGAGSDLQIYHDGTTNNSYMLEGGTGSLILGGTNLYLANGDNSKAFLRGTNNADVALYYNNSIKLTTTSTGIDVTGTITADGLTVDTSTLHVDATNNRVGIGTTSPSKTLHLKSISPILYFEETDIPQAFSIGSGGGKFFVYDETDAAQRLTIDSSGNVGIGTSSPTASASGYNGATLHLSQSGSSNAGSQLHFTTGASGHTATDGGHISYWSNNDFYIYNAEAGNTRFYTNATERMRITSDGEVGINKSTIPNDGGSGYKSLVIANEAASKSARFVAMGAASAYTSYSSLTSGTHTGFTFYSPSLIYTDTMRFLSAPLNNEPDDTNLTERMRLTTTGLGIGTSSISYPLVVQSSGTSTINVKTTATNGYAQLKMNNDAKSYSIGVGAVDQLYFYDDTSSANRIVVDTNGNVSINKDTPSSYQSYRYLEVAGVSSGQGGVIQIMTSGQEARGQWAVDSGGVRLQAVTNHNLSFHTNATQRMTIASYGSVGIGTSTPTNYSTFKYLDIMGGATGTGGVIQLLTSDFSVNLNMYSYNGGGVFGTATNHNLAFLTNNSTKMVILADGKIGVGTTTPSDELTVNGNQQAGDVTIRINNDDTVNAASNSRLRLTTPYNEAYIAAYTGSGGAGYLVFANENAERMRIDSSGNLLLGKTSGALGTAGSAFYNYGLVESVRDGDKVMTLNRLTSDGTIVDFRKASTTVGSISVTSSATAYNTSSDRRLKENIADADDASSLIDAIQVRKFDWKTDGTHQRYGLVAQELNDVFPEAVSIPDNEEEMQSVDYSKLVPMLVKEIQSLRNRITELEAN